MTELAILFVRMGPYHLARLHALAAKVPGSLTVIECFRMDTTYAWKVEESSVPFRRITLLDRKDDPTSTPQAIRAALAAELEAIRPACVAVAGWFSPMNIAAIAWCSRNRVPMIVMSESTHADSARSPFREFVKRRIVGLFSSALAGGQRHADYLENLGLHREQIFTPYDVVDNAHFASGADAARAAGPLLRAKLDLPERFFLASGRFVPKKNFPLLLRAYAAYRNAHGAPGDWKLVLLGDGEGKAELLALRTKLGLGEHLQLPGFKQYDELPAYYGLAGAFVLPSTVEQWGLVANEALAAGLPLLASKRCGCTPDLVRVNENGFTFDPQDEKTLSDLLARIAGMDDPSRSRMAEASRAIVASFSPERFADGLCRARDCALKAGPRRAGLIDRLILRFLLGRT